MIGSFWRHSRLFLFGLSLGLGACATSGTSDHSALLRESALSNLHPAPASMTPPEIRFGDSDRVDPLFMRAQADYYFTLGEALSMEGKSRQAVEAFRLTLIYDNQSALLRLRLAAELLRQGLLSEAIEQAELAAEMDPDSLDARLLLGGLYASMRAFNSALEQYDKIIERRPEHWEAHVFKGLIFAEQGESEKAVRHFRELAQNKNYPEPHMAHHYIGRVHLEETRRSGGRQPASSQSSESAANKKATQAAEQSLKRALSLKPDHLESVLALVEIYQRQGRDEEALRQLESYQRRFGPERIVASMLSQSYIEREEFEKAYEQLVHLESLDEGNLNVRMQMGLILLERKEYEQAAGRFERILQELPESDRIRFYLAAVYEQLEKWDLARTHYAKIPSGSTYYPEAIIQQAYILRNSGRLGLAVSVVKEALERRKDLPELYAFYASLLEEQKNHKVALEALTEAVERFPNQAQLHFFMGSVQERLGKVEETIFSMRRVLELEPDHAQALNFLAYTYAELDRNLEEAEVLARRALTLQPKDGYILDTVGWVLFKQGRVEEAIPYLEKAFKKEGQESIIAVHLGDAYYRQQLVEKAKRMYRRALEMESDASKRAKINAKLSAIEQQSNTATAARLAAPRRTPASVEEPQEELQEDSKSPDSSIDSSSP